MRNGVSYTFQVRALNGGGWGSWADTTAITPRPDPTPATIMINGSRASNDWKARIAGQATGLTGATVTSMVRLATDVEFTAGSSRTVAADGQFTWQRRLSPDRSLEIYFTADGATSNTITIAAVD